MKGEPNFTQTAFVNLFGMKLTQWMLPTKSRPSNSGSLTVRPVSLLYYFHITLCKLGVTNLPIACLLQFN